jgi:hypothetical protein
MDEKKAAEWHSAITEREAALRSAWVDRASEIWKIYSGDAVERTPFNILYSNTEILVPALFSQAPVPLVRRRFDRQEGDLLAKAAERMLSYCMDTNQLGYPTFTEAVESAVLDAALPGQGLVRVRRVQGLAQLDYVPWDNFTWGYARRWEDVPWVSFRHDKKRADIIREFGVSEKDAERFPKDGLQSGQTEEAAKRATFPVYELWDRQSGKITFLCEQLPGLVLLETEDELKLSGFFPVPAPLKFLSHTGDLVPRPLYRLYEEQARELNALTARIKAITKAIKVRGIYNGTLPDFEQLFQSDEDNRLIPATSASVMTQDGGLDRMIWFLPVEKLVLVLRELHGAREACKATIYEILGIGDILRGVSRASETLGAQQLKDKWGSLRINKARERVSRFVRDSLRLLLEVSAQSPEPIWQAVTGLQLPSTIEVAVLQQAGQPAPQASWPALLQALQSDFSRSYLIDIETNSTVDSEAVQDKQDVAEFMNALGQALAGLGPLAQHSPEGFQASKAILVEFCKKFRMGPEIQVILEKMQPAAGGGLPPEVQKQLEQAQQDLAKREEALQAQQTAQVQQATQDKEEIRQLLTQLQTATVKQKEFSVDLMRREGMVEVHQAAVKLAEQRLALAQSETSPTGAGGSQ